MSASNMNPAIAKVAAGQGARHKARDLMGGAGRRQLTFANSLQGANLGAIFHSMDAEVDLGKRLLLLYCANGIVYLLVAALLR